MRHAKLKRSLGKTRNGCWCFRRSIWGIEEGEEAARLAAQAVKLAPEMADAHRALGLGLHIALSLERRQSNTMRALELDPPRKKLRAEAWRI